MDTNQLTDAEKQIARTAWVAEDSKMVKVAGDFGWSAVFAAVEAVLASRVPRDVEKAAEAAFHVSAETMEALAEAEHERWCDHAIAALCDMTETRTERWTRQMCTPYSMLSEAEKEQDRKQVRKTLAILFSQGA